MTSSPSPSPLYAIPGLGTDARIFGPLAQHLPLHPLAWLSPEEGEGLHSYAARMAIGIDHPRPWLLGVSFGGVVAQEIARIRPVRGLILVSSLKPGDQRPGYLRLFRRYPLYRLSRGKWRIYTLPLWAPRFGVHRRVEQRLLQDIFKQFDDRYRMWAIHQLAHWQGQPISVPYLHLHGQRDRVIPARGIRHTTLIPVGTHFMVYQQAEAVAQAIREWQEA